MRIDRLLVEKGLAPSRTQAQALIASGQVFLRTDMGERRAVTKSSYELAIGESLEVETQSVHFVSRGGLKIRGAIERVSLEVLGLKVLDVGISTGGFADFLLQAGSARVVGVDVGHGQLAPKLRADSRVQLFEGVNARDLSSVPLLEANDGEKFDLIVADVSFISLTLVLPEAIQYLKGTGSVLSLVKPQFEVGRDGLGKNGIVKDPARYRDVEEKIRLCCQANGLIVEDYFESSIEGTDGNREFFLYARPHRRDGVNAPHDGV